MHLKLYWQRSWGLIFSETFQSLQWCCCCVLHSLPQNTVLPQNVVGASFKYHELCTLAWSLGKFRNCFKFWLKAAVVNFLQLSFFFFLTLLASKGLAGLGSLQLEWSIYTYLQSPLMMMETSLKINQLSSCFPGLFLQLKNCRMVCVGSTSEEVKAMMGGILF